MKIIPKNPKVSQREVNEIHQKMKKHTEKLMRNCQKLKTPFVGGSRLQSHFAALVADQGL